MALAEVLSALRVLILDQEQFPEDRRERLSLFKTKFPKLSTNELEDLAKISPEKLKIYTHSIFTSQVGVLRNKFKLTFDLISKVYKEHLKEPYSTFGFIRELHKTRPWRTNLTRDLVNNFSEFVKNDCPDLVKHCPSLTSVLEIERLSLFINRASDDLFSIRNSLALEDLSQMTVADLMATQFFIPNLVKLQSFPYDVVAYHSAFIRDGEIPSKKPVQIDCYAVGARNKYLNPRWTLIGKKTFDFLSETEKSVKHPLEAFAEHYVSSYGEGKSEEQVFAGFMDMLAELNRIGAVVVL